MSGIINRMVEVDGWSVKMDGDEPTIRDEELGLRLGFARPVTIRDLIKRQVRDGKLNDVRFVRTARSIELRPGVYRDQVVSEYWLTEKQALKVIAKSETTIADRILDEVINVFVAVRRGLLAVPVAAPPPASTGEVVPILSTSPLVGESHLRSEFASWCSMAARSRGVSVQRIHGAVRRQFRVGGIYHLPLVLYPQARDLVEALAHGRLLLPRAPRKALPSSAPVAKSAQCKLPFAH